MHNLKVSIITVTCNAAQFIEGAIESVLSQSYKNIEYIIIDGSSKDHTINIINKYKDKISTIISEKDEGIYDAMNKGIKCSTGDILYFLNSDDRFYDEEVVSDVVKYFNEQVNIEIVYGKVILTNLPKHLNIRRSVIKNKFDLLTQNICHQAIFSKRNVFDKTSLFDLKYKVYADYNWLLSAFNNNISIGFIDRYIAIFRFQGFSYRNEKKAIKEGMQIAYKNFNIIIYIYYIFRVVFIRTLNHKIRNIMFGVK